MALCLKCLIGGGGSGGGLLPADPYRFRVELEFEPVSDGEVEGSRSAVFEGDIVAGEPQTGVSATGMLVGNFGINPDEQIEQQATVETYSRDGSLGLIAVAVRDGSGRVTFSANLTPQRADVALDEITLDAQVFMGWPEGSATSD